MEPIAIIGLAFKLPQGVDDESEFWDVLEKGRSLMTTWPKSRANADAFLQSHHKKNNTLPTKGAHFLSQDPTTFDAPFFSISSKEAASMDPQQRMLLEASYHAFESAGIPIEMVAGTPTGVYSGSMESDYHRIISKDPDEAPNNTATGASVSILANRLSWYFDLKGPSMQLNTACSSSMLAVDLACQSLHCGQSSMALVTGSNLMLSPELSLYLANMNMISPDGISYSFDQRANGYSRGEGVIVLVLKTLSSAIQNSDPIRAVIRATGSNQDGRTPGITQPSFTAQESLIRQVYRTGGLGIESTRYVEAHGTGTQIGDSTEMKALGAVFRSSRSPGAPLYVGSVKSNIGHLEGGSGLAGILKCIMILEKAIIPPNALFETLNTKINGKRNNIQVPHSAIPWPSSGLRRVSVNSFGFGGSNSHCIIDDAHHTLEALSAKQSLTHLNPPAHTTLQESSYDVNDVPRKRSALEVSENLSNGVLNTTTSKQPTDGTAKSSVGVGVHVTEAYPHANGTTTPDALTKNNVYQLLVYSAREEAALKRIHQQNASYYDNLVQERPDMLRNLAYTLATRRSLMVWRSFAVGNAALPSHDIGLPDLKCVRSLSDSQLCLVFTGQGAQYAKMGLDLVEYPVFKATLTEADKVFRNLGADWSLFDELEHGEHINLPEFSQPLCTSIQLAVFELLKSFSIDPVAVVGHSSGEIAAAYAIGALSLEFACKVAYHRGRLSGQLVAELAASASPGAMMSVNLPEGNFRTYRDEHLPGADIYAACINSPSNITLAGAEADIDALKSHLDADNIFAQKLTTGIAYHTPVMQQIASEYLACLADLGSSSFDSTAKLMISSVTGQRVTSHELLTAQYWVDNLTSPVRFVDALQYLSQAAPRLDGIKSITDYVEVGPHGALRRPILDTLNQVSNGKTYRYVSVLSKRVSPVKTIMEAAGHLLTHGHSISIHTVNRQDRGKDAAWVLTDAPRYPFDHSRKYWYESRLSRDWRKRAASPTDVLGIRVADWNPFEPRWRKFLSIEETPWIADHVVDRVIIFPAAGSVVMALEAVKQTAQLLQPISGFLVKSAIFSSPIIVHPEQKTEVITQLRAIQHAYEKSSLRFEVIIFSVSDEGSWTECFRGTIHAQVKEDSATEVDEGLESRKLQQSLFEAHKSARLTCTETVEKQHFYEWLDKQSLSYGKAFAIADDIFWDGHELCIARVENSPEPYGVVHPTVLDSCLQMCSTAPSEGMTKTLSTFIPHQMRDTFVSISGWQYPQTHSIQVRTQSKLNLSLTGLKSSITVLADDGSLLCHAKHVEMSVVAKQASTENVQKQLLHSIDWKPQLSMLTPSQLSNYCGVDKFTDESFAVEYCVRLENALRACLARDLAHLQEMIVPGTPEHLRSFVSWIEFQTRHNPTCFPDDMSDESLSEELETLRTIRPSWRMFIDVLRNLTSIILTEIDPLELIFSTALAQDVYDEYFARTCNSKLFAYLELAIHQTPNQKVLEVGAGTGGMTDQVLKMFRRIENRTGGTAFREYVYTDVSPVYFEGARERFAEYRDRMSFKTLDLEQDVTTSIEPGTYDMILAGSVLHATKNLSHTLASLRQALKPGGQIVFLETTSPDCFVVNFGFGILPGWWCGEEKSRKWSPSATEATWDALLRNNMFSGNDLVIRDYADERAHHVSIIVSSAVASLNTTVGRVLIVVKDQVEEQETLASGLLREAFNALKYDTLIVPLSQIPVDGIGPMDKIVLLADLEGSLLAEPSVETFHLIQKWVLQSRQLLWVTASDTASPTSPYTGLKDGFLRVIRSENDSKRVISLTMENHGLDSPESVHYITSVFQSAFEDTSPDFEYIVRNGRVLTGRLISEGQLNSDLNSSIHAQTKTEAWLPGPPVKLDIGTRGSLDTLRFVEDEVRTTLGPTEVEIENEAFALGFRDVFSALGRLDENDFGTDIAGVVKRVGSHCTKLRPGDRVCTSRFGCMRTYVYCDESDALKISEDLSVEEACGVINPVMTAWYSLVDIARLKRGEKILIHAAAGATGQVAIQIARMIGAEIFATVGYEYKKQLLIETYGMPTSHIFYSRDLSFVQGIMRVTEGYGVDVVLNSLVGEGLRASWECVAPYGRFIEIGKADFHANAPLPMANFANNASFTGVDLRHLYFHREDVNRKLFFKTMGLVQDGLIHCPKPWHTFSVSAIEEAFRYLQSGKSTGRVVVRIEHSAKVQKHLITRKTWNFDENATYMVAAGLGGVGRSILRWMAAKGAKQLIVPSRSGAASNEAIAVVDELTRLGVKIATPKCDVAVACSVSKVLQDYAHWGRVRGCINAAMILQDSVFESMTLAQWNTTIQSKMKTTWNLYDMLPKDMEFFLLLSSASGIIGNAGQSNYAAGCTFQDMMARTRTNKQKMVSIDLGPMRSVGVVAEHEGLRRSFEKYPGLQPIEEQEFLALLNILCDPNYDSRGLTEGHFSMGIVTPDRFVSDGNDMPLEHLYRSLFAYFSDARVASSFSAVAGNINSSALFLQAESVEEKTSIVVDSLVRKLARAMSIKIENVDVDRPLHLYGVDSLVALELRNWITREFAVDVPVFELMSGKTVLGIGQLVTKGSSAVQKAISS